MKSLITTVMLGSLLTQFGLTGFQNADGTAPDAEQQAAAAFEAIVPVSEYGAPLGMTISSRADIDSDVNAGVQQLDRSVRQLPGYAVKVASQVEQHGVAALAYDNPEMKKAGRDLGLDIGGGIRHFAVAVGKDMVATAHESGIGHGG